LKHWGRSDIEKVFFENVLVKAASVGVS